MQTLRRSEKISFINYWKIVEALIRPKGIIVHLKNLYLV